MATRKNPLSFHDFLTVKDVQQVTNSARTTVHLWIRKGGLPARKVGGKVLVLREDLDAWISTQPGWNLDRSEV